MTIVLHDGNVHTNRPRRAAVPNEGSLVHAIGPLVDAKIAIELHNGKVLTLLARRTGGPNGLTLA
jgi:hypothetical protein